MFNDFVIQLQFFNFRMENNYYCLRKYAYNPKVRRVLLL